MACLMPLYYEQTSVGLLRGVHTQKLEGQMVVDISPMIIATESQNTICMRFAKPTFPSTNLALNLSKCI